jgi:hypothetical protein
VYEAIQKRAGRNHQDTTLKAVAVLEREPAHAAVLDKNSARLSEDPIDGWLTSQCVEHPATVSLLVGLRARRPDGWPAASIEHLELNAGRVDGSRHQPAECIDFRDEVTFRGSANGGIARHMGDGVRRQRADRHVPAHPGGRMRRLAARMSGANHNHVIFHA